VRLRIPRLRLKAALVLLAVASVAALVWVHYRPLYQRANDARSLLLSAQDTLQQKQLDATPAELAEARSQLETAQQYFQSSRSALRRDPLVRLVHYVPWLGKQVSAAEDVLMMGRDASEIGLAGVAVAGEYSYVRNYESGNTSEKTMTLLDRVGPEMGRVSDALETLLADRNRIAASGLLPPLKSALAEVDEHSAEISDLVETYNQAAAFFPDFLGFKGPRTYLVLAQNNAELLPTGGLISVYGVVTLKDGSVESMSFADAIAFGEDWQNRTHEYVEPPAPLKNYLLKDWSWSLDVSNWSPDFPTAAQQAEAFFERQGGSPVDGVIAINVDTLEQLLGVTGPVDVADYNVTVDPSNVLDTTEALTRTPLEPGSDRKAFAAFLAEEMLHRLLYLPPDQWSPLLDTAEGFRDQKTVLFFSSDPAMESLAHQMKLDGALEETSGDYLMPVEASVNSTKLNIAIDKRIEMDVSLDDLGDAQSTVKLSYRNDLATWEQGRDPLLVQRLMLGGLYGGYLRLFTGPASRLLDVSIDGVSAGPEEIGSESGKGVFGRFFALPKGASREVAFSYVTPAVVDLTGETASYRLFIQKQPGTGAVPLTLHFMLPARAKLVSLDLDGKQLGGDSLEVQTDLSRDREIVLTYESSG
jgi:hypothetical protein